MASDILIVDDEADIRELVAGILEDEGHETRVAGNSDAALQSIADRVPRLVFLDIWLQGSRLDGLDLLGFATGSQRSREQVLRNVALMGTGPAAGLNALSSLTLAFAYCAPDPATGINPTWQAFGYDGPPRIAPGGRFVFTVERLAPGMEAARLGRLGRYAHSEAHVIAAARDAGLEIISLDEDTLRLDGSVPVHGLVVVLGRAA